MTRNQTLICVTILMVIIVYTLYRKSPQIHNELTNYTVESNTGSVIPAKLYERAVTAVDGNIKRNVKELILAFNDKLVFYKGNMKGEKYLHKYIILVPELKIMGLPENSDSFIENGDYIYQHGDEANKFTPMVNNKAYFTDPPISVAIFHITELFSILMEY